MTGLSWRRPPWPVLVRYLLLARQPETRLVDAFAVAIDRSADRRRGGSVVCRLRVSTAMIRAIQPVCGRDDHRMRQAGPAMRRGVVVGAGHDADMTNPVSPEAQGRYRCPDRGGPGGQRCQLLIEHATPAHIASIGGTFRAWVDRTETALPPRPYPWFVSFPQDES
jgi:hypothetical protein